MKDNTRFRGAQQHLSDAADAASMRGVRSTAVYELRCWNPTSVEARDEAEAALK